MEKPLKSDLIVPSKNETVAYNYHIDEYLYLKVCFYVMQEPVDDTYTKFIWQKAPIKPIQQFIFNLSPEQIKNLSFQ